MQAQELKLSLHIRLALLLVCAQFIVWPHQVINGQSAADRLNTTHAMIDVVTRPGEKFLIFGWENDADTTYEIYRASSITTTDWVKIAELPPIDDSRRSYVLPIQSDRSAQFVFIKQKGDGNEGEVSAPTESPMTISELELEMMPIPAGKFVMGSPAGEKDRDDDEGPQTTVTISKPFWLGKTEVTQAQWKTVMGSDPSYWKGNYLPVESVTWFDAVAFCEKLNEMKSGSLFAGYRYTLPTEAQWEYACRAGTSTRFYYGDDADYSQLEKYAWYAGNCPSKTHTVGARAPNNWGLHDMHGNVWEWCLDWSGDYTGGSVSDPPGPSSGQDRVIRGGGWNFRADYSRSAYRNYYWTDAPYDSLGFRIALSPVHVE